MKIFEEAWPNLSETHYYRIFEDFTRSLETVNDLRKDLEKIRLCNCKIFSRIPQDLHGRDMWAKSLKILNLRIRLVKINEDLSINNL